MKVTTMKRTLSGTLALLALAAAPVGAQVWTACSSGSMQTCASFEAFSFYDGTNTELVFHVQNLHFIRTLEDGTQEFGGSILAQFGVLTPELDIVETNAPYAYDDNVDVEGNPGEYWSEGISSANRLGSVTWALVAGTDDSSDSEGGILSCANPERNPDNMSAYFRTCENGWVVFSITARGDVDLDDVTLAWGVTSNSFDGESYQGSTEVVPEPATIALMAMGLIGVGAVGYRSRRREGELEDDDA